ncbi:MAG: hypothetical protein AABX11_05095 [Nanoarchaeota archaeon]
MNKYEEFLINGQYQHRNQDRRFRGEIRSFEDGRVVGVMMDNWRVNCPEERKIVFGLKENKRLVFWKLSPDPILDSSVYILYKNDGRTEFEGAYQGRLAPIGRKKKKLVKDFGEYNPMVELGNCFENNDTSRMMEILGSIERERISEMLDRRAINYIFRESKRGGYAEISRVQSFCA